MAELIKMDGTREALTDLSLPALQTAVDGYIEYISLDDERVLVVNEDGRMRKLGVNMEASRIMMRHGPPAPDPVIVGNVVCCSKGELD